MNPTEEKYRLNFSLDLIYYLSCLLLYSHSNKVEMITEILNKWESKVDNQLNKAKKEDTKSLSKESGYESDVVDIIISAHQQPMLIVKKDFKELIQKILTNGMTQDMERRNK